MPYTFPDWEAFLLRFPEFQDAVDRPTIENALAEAGRSVDASWAEGDYQPAIMLLAAHLLSASTGIGTPASEISSESFGSISLSYKDRGDGGAKSAPTTYYERYMLMQRRNAGGPVVV